MPESTFVHPLFGPIRFRTATSNRWIRGDQIAFLSGFNEADVVPVQIPQLAAVPGAHGGRLQFHQKGHAQLLSAFAEIEKNGLMPLINTCAGSFNRRLSKPTSGGISKIPSNHAFGIAIDLNADDGSLGASIAPLAPVFKAHGFKWGEEFASKDPMHFEASHFEASVAPLTSHFIACRQKVLNRGAPPEAFLAELVEWGRSADDDVFSKNDTYDIYSSVVGILGPWRGDRHRRAVMLEVLRVLAGFESSWNWDEGVDEDKTAPNTACTEEAGILQCSGDSMKNYGLTKPLVDVAGKADCGTFITTTKSNHPFALEYCARLLRRTTKHHGPIKRQEIHAWLRQDAVDEFMGLLG